MAKRILSRAERHIYFNRIMDKNPWMKKFYIAYAVAVVIGFCYVLYNHVDMAEVLDEVEFFGFVGALSLVMLPIVIYKLKVFCFGTEEQS
jgi:hypothetical protein